MIIAMQPLQRPAVFHKPGDEIVEQGRMRGEGAGRPEIAGRVDQTAPEMLLPDAVDDDPRP